MKKIRIGNDIVIKWRVTINGEEVNLDGLDLSLYISTTYQPRKAIAFTVAGNEITATYKGAEQKVTGVYRLTLYRNEGENAQSILDACDAFELVSCSCLTVDAAFAGAEVELPVADLGVGIPGLSAYEIAVAEGYEGTQAEWLASLSAASEAAAAECRKFTDEAKISEKERQDNEALRVTAENERAANETTRQSAEATRATNERNRTTSESQRVAAEQQRVTAETARSNAESSRATAETARQTAETARQEAEQGRVTAEQQRADAEAAREEEFATFEGKIAAKEDVANKVTSINADADDVHYPSAKAVWSAMEKSRTNIHFVREIDSTYTSFGVPFFFPKGAYIKNNGVTIILGKDASFSVRQDIEPNVSVLIQTDMYYIRTSTNAGVVDFEIINSLPYEEWKEREVFLPKRYIFNGYTSYSTVNTYTVFPKNATIINHGVNLIFFENSALDGRIDVAAGDSVVLNSDKKYLRLGSTSGTVDFEVFYAPINSVNGDSIIDGSISKEKASFIESINLVRKIKVGMYYSGTIGAYGSNPIYDATERIHVIEGQSYCWNSRIRFVHMLDSNGTVAVRTVEEQPAGGYITAESGEKFMIVTFHATDEKLYQIEKGLIPTAYTDPAKMYIDPQLIPPSGSEKVPISFRRWNQIGTIATGEILTTQNINITKNTAMTALIKGNIESVTMGVALNGYYGKNITLTPTELIVRAGTDNSVSATYQHGLNITDFAFIQISKGDDSEASVRLSNDKGEKYENVITWATNIGLPFVLNESSENLDVTFSFMPRDITKDIWMFGDSYFGMYDTSRWPYYILQWGYNQFLLDAKGGENATEGLEDFKSLLSLGARPKYVVWCHGMNGGRDDSTEPNATWLARTQEVIDLCLRNDIIPILATIPSVPTEIHVKLNEWIKASGHRYIDFASVVESVNDYYWKGWGTTDALLSTDEIHPTVKGAVALASQVMIDFPEITVAN